MPADDGPTPLSPAESRPVLAPAWLPFVATWLGLLVLVASITWLFLPGSAQPKQELEHARPYSLQDRFLPVPLYGTAVVLFLAIVPLWQMRKEPRPLPLPLTAQRLQCFAAITLAIVAATIVYSYVALHGPR